MSTCVFRRFSRFMSCTVRGYFGKLLLKGGRNARKHGSKENWQFFKGASQGKKYNAGNFCRDPAGIRTYSIQVGNGSFPNKRILRNSPCLPACRQKNIAIKKEILHIISVLVSLSYRCKTAECLVSA